MKFLACCSALLLVDAALGLNGLRRGLATDDEAAAEWTYRTQGTPGEEPYGPDDWYLGYPDCAGTRQSPINLAADSIKPGSAADYPLDFSQTSCNSTELVFQGDFAVWQVYFDGCTNVPFVTYQGEKYNLLQWHIHSPSEYTFGGAEYAAGIHLVHVKEGTSDLLVVGVLFDVSEYGTNHELEKVWKVINTGATSSTEVYTVSAYDILPHDPSFTHFLGSLTTPPCSEGVKWIVMNTPNYMGKQQLEDYRNAVASYPGSKVSEMGNTNRPIQSVNSRSIIHAAY